MKSVRDLSPMEVKRPTPATWQRGLVVALPLLLFMVASGLGLWAVFAQSHTQSLSRKEMAKQEALRYTSSLELVLHNVFIPVRALSLLVRGTPGHNVGNMRESFGEWADSLLNMTGWGPSGHSNHMSLQLAPSGVITLVHPFEGNEASLGHNIIRYQDTVISALQSIKNNSRTLQGPYIIKQGYLAALVRVPVFVKGDWPRNETFGAPEGLDPSCPDFCYHSGHQEGDRFWGFIVAVVRWEGMLECMQFRLLEDAGYYYRLVRPWIPQDGISGSKEYVLGQSPKLEGHALGGDSISLPVGMPPGAWSPPWTLFVTPRTPFMPAWRWPVMGAVIVGALLASLLLWWILEANHRLRTTGRALRSEKARMDALLLRQYDLIKCLWDLDGIAAVLQTTGGDGSGRDRPPSAGQASDEFHAVPTGMEGLEDAIRTEMARSAVCAGRQRLGNNHDEPDIILMDMLGKGTFGKVYRGMWRGSPVAVKTLLLPASLTPNEKREKMVVMETAIASSLSHPNVVQTYTYSIRPLCDCSSSGGNVTEAADYSLSPSVVVVGGSSDGSEQEGQRASVQPKLMPGAYHDNTKSHPSTQRVHSHEVLLVLEFCDLGCLRDALNSGAFFTSQGTLNLAAILDTAADVARAMVHLHACGVVHGDLKAANVMLKSGGADGRGAVAKVMDFGLSVRMDTADSHVPHMFQGTITHMAPEVLLEGHLGKASDVYAFAITLYELFTGGMAYQGLSNALLPHRVVTERLRPPLPPAMPPALRNLITCCWDHDPEARPSFREVAAALADMRAAVGGLTPPLNIRNPFPCHGEVSVHRAKHGGHRLHKINQQSAQPCPQHQAGQAQSSHTESPTALGLTSSQAQQQQQQHTTLVPIAECPQMATARAGAAPARPTVVDTHSHPPSPQQPASAAHSHTPLPCRLSVPSIAPNSDGGHTRHSAASMCAFPAHRARAPLGSVTCGGEGGEGEEGMLVLETPEALAQAMADAGGGENSRDYDAGHHRRSRTGSGVWVATPGGCVFASTQQRRHSSLCHRSSFTLPKLPVVVEEEVASRVSVG